MAIRLAPSYKEFMQNMELKMQDGEIEEYFKSQGQYGQSYYH